MLVDSSLLLPINVALYQEHLTEGALSDSWPYPKMLDKGHGQAHLKDKFKLTDKTWAEF